MSLKKEIKDLCIDLQDEIDTLVVINDANLGIVADRKYIDSALNGCVRRLEKLMEQVDALELKLLATEDEEVST